MTVVMNSGLQSDRIDEIDAHSSGVSKLKALEIKIKGSALAQLRDNMKLRGGSSVSPSFRGPIDSPDHTEFPTVSESIHDLVAGMNQQIAAQGEIAGELSNCIAVKEEEETLLKSELEKLLAVEQKKKMLVRRYCEETEESKREIEKLKADTTQAISESSVYKEVLVKSLDNVVFTNDPAC